MDLHLPWLKSQSVRWLVEALGADNVFFVGGAVRNALLELPPAEDIDVATPLVPEVVTERLEALDVRVVPTGLEHGTVTAVIAGQPFEITTFRKDVATDGRRAVVAFTTDIKRDAQRRDFTMNAIYMRPNGHILDPVSGIYDLRAGRVKFIGDADERIREDYLRIYRYFRFQALFGVGHADADVLAVVHRHSQKLASISAERIRVEMLKMLAGPADELQRLLTDMQQYGVNPAALLTTNSIAALGHMMSHRPLASAQDARPLIRLAVLARVAGITSAELQESLKLSKKQSNVVAVVARAPDSLGLNGLKSLAYFDGPVLAAAQLDVVRDLRERRPDLVDFLAHYEKPTYPVSAADLMALGYRPGPELGSILRDLEKKWAQSGFLLTRADLLADHVLKEYGD